MEGKRSPFGIRNFEFLNFELFSATPAILNYSIFDLGILSFELFSAMPAILNYSILSFEF